MAYRHTQRGTLILTVCLSIGIFGVVIWWITGDWRPAAFMVLIDGVVGLLFSSLTVEVGDTELRWHFGPGLLNYRLPLDEISNVAVVRNEWWNGWGIRIARGFRLYNVSGLDAVELRLKSNDVRRIGTDDPQGLAAALRPHQAA
jgi:hypothetical protein